MNYLMRSFFYGSCPLVKLPLGFSWIQKGGLFLNVALFTCNYETSVFKTENVDGRQWKVFYVVSYSDEPCLGMVIFLYAPSVLVWNFFVMDGGGGGGGRSEHIPRVVYETLKQWKLLRYHPPSSTLLVLIGTSPFAFNKYLHKPYIFWKLNSSRLLLLPFKKSKY